MWKILTNLNLAISSSDTRGKDLSVHGNLYIFFCLSGRFIGNFGVTTPRQFTPKDADVPSASHSLQITPAFLRDADLV